MCACVYETGENVSPPSACVAERGSRGTPSVKFDVIIQRHAGALLFAVRMALCTQNTGTRECGRAAHFGPNFHAVVVARIMVSGLFARPNNVFCGYRQLVLYYLFSPKTKCDSLNPAFVFIARSERDCQLSGNNNKHFSTTRLRVTYTRFNDHSTVGDVVLLNRVFTPFLSNAISEHPALANEQTDRPRTSGKTCRGDDSRH